MTAIFLAAVLALSPAPYRADVMEARHWLRERTTPRQFRCFHTLWERESHWRVRAGARRLSSGGAFGIPQSRPGHKMRSAGRDWRTNAVTQVRWGKRYVKARYGTACRALAWQSAAGWY